MRPIVFTPRYPKAYEGLDDVSNVTVTVDVHWPGSKQPDWFMLLWTIPGGHIRNTFPVVTELEAAYNGQQTLRDAILRLQAMGYDIDNDAMIRAGSDTMTYLAACLNQLEVP